MGKRLSDVNFEALPPLSPIFESSNVIPLPAGEIFEAETDCVKFEKAKDVQSFAAGDFIVPNLDPEIYTLPSKPLICKIQNVSEDGEDIQIGFCEGSERLSLWFKPIQDLEPVGIVADDILTRFSKRGNYVRSD